MAYTPELSQQASSMLRRIAWATGKPMTKTLEEIIEYLPRYIRKEEVCNKCRDKSLCSGCGFNQNHCVER
ncbi:MAG: hypothetical protein WCQ90_08010 [Deltaproteobacteria bacterium]